MNILIVYSHPEPKSFNQSIRGATEALFESQGDTVVISDLYGEKFNPVESNIHYHHRIQQDKFEPLVEQRHAYQTRTLSKEIDQEINRLEQCDLLILQFPLWWHQQPAMIKGWCDRVFVSGGLYTSKMRYDQGYFKGKKAICLTTSGAPLATFTDKGRGGGKINDLLHPLNYSLHYMGFTVLPAYLITEVQSADFTYKNSQQLSHDLLESKTNWLNHIKNVHAIKPLSFPSWEDWDKNGVEKR